MALSFKKLAQAQLSTVVAATYTVPAATQAIIKSIVYANTSGLAVAVTAYDGAADDAHTITPGVSVPGTGLYTETDTKTMDAGQVFRAKAGANTSVTVTIYGLETA